MMSSSHIKTLLMYSKDWSKTINIILNSPIHNKVRNTDDLVTLAIISDIYQWCLNECIRSNR